MKNRFLVLIVFTSLCFSSGSYASNRAEFESALIKLRIRTNAPQPISAFYEGRGFQKNMIDILKQQCFVSVSIKNKSQDFIWLDLAHWHFSNADGKLERLDRNYWKKRWQSMNIPLAHQSIFRWTLLPEQLNFYPAEREGGNIILPRTGKPFNIEARFDTGKNRDGKPVIINFNHVSCATDK